MVSRSERHRPASMKGTSKTVMFNVYLEKREMAEHVGYSLSITSLIKEVQLERHVLFGLFHQPHEGKVWEQPMDHPHQHLHITNQNQCQIQTGIHIYCDILSVCNIL